MYTREALSREREQALLDKIKNEDQSIEEQKTLLRKINREAQKLQSQKKSPFGKTEPKAATDF